MVIDMAKKGVKRTERIKATKERLRAESSSPAETK